MNKYDNTIFKSYEGLNPFNREQIRWEESLYKLTPIQESDTMCFKREDFFAPIGYHSVNGSKLRQCIWLVNSWVQQKNILGVCSGSVVGSPQHPFIASICKHYGIGCVISTGSKNWHEHKNMEMADQLGAKIVVNKIGYARALQSISFKLAKKLPNHEVLETNITVDEKINPPSVIEAFHKVGSYQVKNIPENIENIIIPCGSCNSVVSILYGLALERPVNLKKVVLMGIGNNGSYHLNYIPRRLKIISDYIGTDLNSVFFYDMFREESLRKGSVKIEHFNLNGTGFCEYSDWMPFNDFDIEFHPRYEGKCMNFMYQNKEIFDQFLTKKTLFWIVGNEPKYIDC